MSRILILNQVRLESSLDYLYNWLLYSRIPFLCFNGEDFFKLDRLATIPNDLHFKPLKCGYDPYANVWEDWSIHPLKQSAITYYGKKTQVK